MNYLTNPEAFKRIMRAIDGACSDHDAPVEPDMIAAALLFIQEHGIDLKQANTWLDGGTRRIPLPLLVDAIAYAHYYREIADYLRRMSKYAGEDIPLIYPLNDLIYVGELNTSMGETTAAAWLTWVRDVLCIAAEAGTDGDWLRNLGCLIE